MTLRPTHSIVPRLSPARSSSVPIHPSQESAKKREIRRVPMANPTHCTPFKSIASSYSPISRCLLSLHRKFLDFVFFTIHSGIGGSLQDSLAQESRLTRESAIP